MLKYKKMKPPRVSELLTHNSHELIIFKIMLLKRIKINRYI